eukprot:TRINITY_DN4610_c0_g1_i1.p2 TRINITY_DN4610_c0_g1~~TRINITY_DN4610_c0_g1_i1.p2  ORF type:complete len:204 (-),score=32.36 TRINITY_DN4610_c0_g1_i1:229-840(-)
MSAAQRPAVPERFSKLVGPNESFLCSETFTTGDRQTTLLFTSQKYYALVLQAEVYKKLWVRDLREIQSVHAEPGSSTLNIKYLTRWHEHNDYLQTRTFEAQHASDPYLCFSWKVAITAQLRAIWQATLESALASLRERHRAHRLFHAAPGSVPVSHVCVARARPQAAHALHRAVVDAPLLVWCESKRVVRTWRPEGEGGVLGY